MVMPNSAQVWENMSDKLRGLGPANKGGGGGSSGGGGGGGINYYDPQLANSNLNTGYLDQMRGLAAGGANGNWQQGQMNQSQIREAGDMDALQNQGASGMATQQGNMAMRGGITSGASERLGSQNMMGMLQGQSNIARGAASREQGIRSAADERHRGLLGQLGNAEIGAAQHQLGADQWNAGQQNEAQKYKMNADAIMNQNMSNGDSTPFNNMLGGMNPFQGTGIGPSMGSFGQLDAGDALLGASGYTATKGIANSMGGMFG